MESDISALVKARGVLQCGRTGGRTRATGQLLGSGAGLLWHFESICLGVQVQLSKERGFGEESVVALGCSGPGAGGVCRRGGTQASAAIK